MPPSKRLRDEFVAAAAPPAKAASRGCPLPADLLLEIFARTDAATLFRCSATCRSLRRDIRRPAFIRRVCHDGAVPPRLLGFLGLDLGLPYMPPPSFSLAYPATPVAASLSETRLALSLIRGAGADAGRLAGYRFLMSRDGLVLLSRRRWVYTMHEMTMCVYDAMTGKGTFFPGPPDTGTERHGHDSYSFYDKFVLLTDADGVGCLFLICSADFSGLRKGSDSVLVRTFSPSDSQGSAWSPVAFASHFRPFRYSDKEPCDNVAVLHGGLIHWLIRGGKQDFYIFTYNVLTAASGWIELPAEVPAICRANRKLHLICSPSGRQLNLLSVDKFKVSVWLLLSADDDGACWARQTVIDTMSIVYSVGLRGHHPDWTTGVDIIGSGARSGAVILLSTSIYCRSRSDFEEAEEGIIVLDLETKEMRAVSKKKHTFVYEVDMASRLSAMKNF